MDPDRITMLHECLIHKILSYLPLKDIVRTSILSSNWRYRWTTIPTLVFDEGCCRPPSDDISVCTRELISIIDHVLLLHTGLFQVLHLDGVCSVPDVDRWILHASRRSIQKLVLAFEGDRYYLVPSSLYTCESLTHLNLTHCLMRIPPSFKGFKRLRVLMLTECILTQHIFESLVSSSPYIEQLTLIDCEGLEDLKIDAPNLQVLNIESSFATITFGSVLMKLSEFSIELIDDGPYENDADVESYFAHFFTYLPGIKRLEMNMDFLKSIAVGSIPERLPTPFLNLYHLSIWISLVDLNESLAALCLFKSSPNLTELELVGRCGKLGGDAESSIWVDDSKCHCPFDKLRSVKMRGVSGARVELEFVKFFLVNSPSLETMTVIPYSKEEMSYNFVKDMLRLRRSSARAEIILLDRK